MAEEQKTFQEIDALIRYIDQDLPETLKPEVKYYLQGVKEVFVLLKEDLLLVYGNLRDMNEAFGDDCEDANYTQEFRIVARGKQLKGAVDHYSTKVAHLVNKSVQILHNVLDMTLEEGKEIKPMPEEEMQEDTPLFPFENPFTTLQEVEPSFKKAMEKQEEAEEKEEKVGFANFV